MVSEANLSSTLVSTQANQDVTTLAQDFDDFLTLLTTQLQNQDPLDPLDSNEFTAQLVQFTQAEQLINQNQKLDQLIEFESANATSTALGFVGLEISYLGNRVFSDGVTPQDINYGLNSQASQVDVFIKDDVGNIVRSIDGTINAGSNQVTWDGLDDEGEPVEAGVYTVEIAALDVDGEGMTTSLAVTGVVTGIEQVNGTTNLILRGELGLPVGNVLAAELPDTVVATDTTAEQDSNDGTDSTDTSEETGDSESTSE